MTISEEARVPFLHGANDLRGDHSIELLELSHGHAQREPNYTHDPKSDPPSDHASSRNGIAFSETSIPPKKPATYAILYMLGAQIFSASMNVSIRLLENASTHLHPLQILFVRMSITTFGITFWLLRQRQFTSIVGKQANRPLLLLRAFGGFMGVFGLYYSLRYLNLSEATVITFMMPLVASLGGYLLLGSAVSWLEILLSTISLFGVLLVASPDDFSPSRVTAVAQNESDVVDTASRIWAVCVGLLGVCGSAAAFLCMSSIGKSESPFTIVNYFAALCTLVSCASLVVLPGLGFQMPGDVWEWVLLFFSGLSGFLMQFLITMSLQAEKSLVAVNMVYTQVVFALALDAVVFHTIPHAASFAGCTMICASALVLAWHKTKLKSRAESLETGRRR
ncbi:hypothetical protein N0V93_004864 [Gnomoniopsis smithogilvyi]|uniref:EamA domain-containing protein n=1 Tax=Gnomoniopsis smithogilvyi TaxID=1191159 RepID=A0A9W9CW73_9PEZI|nr:hypothetical protein N0V93_004864 [Gnomoniopsis smithogilvyi]